MTDADVDGAHIRTLLLTFFYRHMPDIIEDGHLYIAQPPLFGMPVGRKRIYAYDEAEREKIIDRLIAERQGKKEAAEAASAVAADASVVATDADEGTNEVAETAAGAVVVEQEDEGAVSDEEKKRLKQAGITGSVQRYKGLGEMNADQLWETTMDPGNRVLLKVNVDDAEKADAIFNKLMGEEVLLRKNFISSRAATLNANDLDI
jgi:DNA gyrase subunit B